MTLHLVRHGRPLIDPGVPAHTWELDPDGFDDIWALRESGRLPQRAVWFTSPEPKAIGTAQLITEQQVGIVDALREQLRPARWSDDFDATVRRAFARPQEPAAEGWETLVDCRTRVLGAVTRLVEEYADTDVVLIGHGVAWSVVAAASTGSSPDHAQWSAWTMPDHLALENVHHSA